MDKIAIRLENPNDYRDVEAMVRASFWRNQRVAEIGVGAAEHFMVHAMRETIGIRELSFLAEHDGQIVGHIAFSRGSYIEQEDGSRVSVLNMGPVSVHPDHQKKGIGGMLIKRALREAKELELGAIFFYGHAEYYPRFGFVDAKVYHVTTRSGKNSPYFMGMELNDGYLEGISGKFIEHQLYNESYTGPLAKVFDAKFTTLNDGAM